ncbi:hypothetical protein [Pseudomonas lini]
MSDNLQATLPPDDTVADGLHITGPRFLLKHTSIRLFDQVDVLEYEVTPGASSVLIFSQKFHHDWHAQVFDQFGWVPAKTTVINGVF